MLQNVLDKAARLISGEEGERLTAYQDSGGAWTIGKGHLIKPGERFFPYGDVRTITKAESDSLFAKDLAEAQSGVSMVKVPLNANERAALLSLVFNIGKSAFASSTLLKLLNTGDRAGAAAQFIRWDYDNGVRVAGLTHRRAREAALFQTPELMA